MSIHPPIIVIGMHRSGTSLLTKTLADLGLFVGEDLQAEHESVFFIRLNDRLLRQCGSTWDYPERYQTMIQKSEWLTRQATQARNHLCGQRAACYAGKKYQQYFRSHVGLDRPWGWKDPRNTITLPLWMHLYPEAKIIHIKRHGVDVAHSLVTRERRFTRIMASLLKAAGSQWPRSVEGKFANPLRCNNLDNAFALWEFYTGQAQAHVRACREKAIEINYENLLSNPVDVLNTLCRFMGLQINHDVISKLPTLVRSSRAFAYRGRKALQEYAARVSDRLEEFGYLA